MGMNHPTLVHVASLTDLNEPKEAILLKTAHGDRWVPARPMGLSTFRNRVRLALMVFTGKADALLWEDQ